MASQVDKNGLYKKLLVMGLPMSLALGGAYLIAPQEGLVLGTYDDGVGVITECYGHVDKSLKLGTKRSQEYCDTQFAKDLIKFDAELSKLVKVEYKTPQQHAAVISFCYNVGVANCKNSTMLKKLNAGNHVGACKEIYKWVYAQGKDCRDKKNNCSGIVTRRTEEVRWCLGEVDLNKEMNNGK